MLKFLVSLVIFCIAFNAGGYTQDTLPSISVKNRYGKIIISWKNAYGARISNINIQRSVDSVKRFSTIGTVLNPTNKENGYVDTKPPAGKIFYRVFVAFDGGEYLFTHSHRPVIDTSKDPVTEVIEEKKEIQEDKKAGVKSVPFVASKFVFTGKDNNVIINLPNAAAQKFSIKFFDENEQPLFELHTIKEPYLILDKVNFLHAGWFKYHLFDNDVLLEKFKFYIPKDTRYR